MKKLTLILMFVMMAFSCTKVNGSEENNISKIETFKNLGYNIDTFTTSQGRQVNIVFIKHGSLAIDIDGYLVYVDPVKMFIDDMSALPKGDMILVTHEHHDHFDPDALETLSDNNTVLMGSRSVHEQYKGLNPLSPDTTFTIKNAGFDLITAPAYNNSPGHENFHPKARKDVGFIFDISGLKIYIAGDTEDIDEMAKIGKKGIDIAFIPVNQPYTMTPEQAIHAAEMLNPTILYPYHYGDTDLTPLTSRFEDSNIEVRVRDMQ